MFFNFFFFLTSYFRIYINLRFKKIKKKNVYTYKQKHSWKKKKNSQGQTVVLWGLKDFALFVFLKESNFLKLFYFISFILIFFLFKWSSLHFVYYMWNSFVGNQEIFFDILTHILYITYTHIRAKFEIFIYEEQK